MATTKNQKTTFDKTILVTGFVAIASILAITILADASINAEATYEREPCARIKCPGTAITRSAENMGPDPFTGNIRCKCPNDPDAYYQVAQWKPYSA